MTPRSGVREQELPRLVLLRLHVDGELFGTLQRQEGAAHGAFRTDERQHRALGGSVIRWRARSSAKESCGGRIEVFVAASRHIHGAVSGLPSTSLMTSPAFGEPRAQEHQVLDGGYAIDRTNRVRQLVAAGDAGTLVDRQVPRDS